MRNTRRVRVLLASQHPLKHVFITAAQALAPQISSSAVPGTLTNNGGKGALRPKFAWTSSSTSQSHPNRLKNLNQPQQPHDQHTGEISGLGDGGLVDASSRREDIRWLKIGTNGRAGELMDRIQQLVASLCSSFLVSDGDRMSQGGMQTRRKWKVRGLTIMKKPEAPGE